MTSDLREKITCQCFLIITLLLCYVNAKMFRLGDKNEAYFNGFNKIDGKLGIAFLKCVLI